MIITKETTAQQVREYIESEVPVLKGKYWRLTEIRKGTSWNAKPTGMYLIMLPQVYSKQMKRFRTKKDGSIDIKAIKAHMVEYRDQDTTRQAFAMQRASVKSNNMPLVEEVKQSYKGNKHFFQFSSTGNFIIPSETDEGKMRVQVDFGSVDVETAKKIMAFVQSLEA